MRLATAAKVFFCMVLLAMSAPALRAQTETATQFYTKYLAAFAKATKLEQIQPLMSKKMNAQINETPAAERPQTFEMIKMISSMNTGIKVVKETATPTGATLNVEATGPDKKKVTGVVTIAKESGAWKLDGESWKN